MTNWEYKGVGISITGSGKFRAQLDSDVLLTTNTLAEMRQTIEKELKSIKKRSLKLKVAVVAYPKHKPEKSKVLGLVLTGINRTSRNYVLEGLPQTETLGYDDFGVLPDTPSNRSLLEQIISTRKALSSLEEQARSVELKPIGGYGRISAGAYEIMLQGLEDRYEKALARSKGK